YASLAYQRERAVGRAVVDGQRLDHAHAVLRVERVEAVAEVRSRVPARDHDRHCAHGSPRRATPPTPRRIACEPSFRMQRSVSAAAAAATESGERATLTRQ